MHQLRQAFLIHFYQAVSTVRGHHVSVIVDYVDTGVVDNADIKHFILGPQNRQKWFLSWTKEK